MTPQQFLKHMLVSAMNEGAPIAQKIANVTISSDNLQALVDLRRISMALMKRIKANYNGIVGFNGALVGGGVLGIMPPSQTAWLHNLSHWVSA